jgi:hypothetical protein
MDREEARGVLSRELKAYQRRTYPQLRALIGSLRSFEVPHNGGHPYQIEIQVIWDGKVGGDIRVLGAIDDGGWSAFRPLTDDFIVGPGDVPTAP